MKHSRGKILLSSLALAAAPLALAAPAHGEPAYQVTTISVGGLPAQAIYDATDDKIFVDGVGYDGTDDVGDVYVIDPATDAVSATVQVSTDPNAPAPEAMTLDEADHRLYVSLGSEIAEVDTTADSVVGSLNLYQMDGFDCPCDAGSISWDPTSQLLYTNDIQYSTDQNIYAIDPAAQTMTWATTLSEQPQDLLADPDTGMIYGAESDEVSVFDPSTASVTDSITAASPASMAYDQAEQQIDLLQAATGPGDSVVSTLDTATDTLTTTSLSGPYLTGAVDPSSGTFYVNDWDADSVVPMDVVAQTAGAPIAVGTHPNGLAVDTSTGAVYTANRGDGTVSVITPHTATTPTQTTLTASPNPVVAGQVVTYVATVSPPPGGAQPGNITFTEPDGNGGTAVICSGGSLSSGGTETCTHTYGAAGSRTVTAHYNGNAGYDPSFSGPVTVQVTTATTPPPPPPAPAPAPASLVLTAAHGKVTYGRSDPLSGTLSAVGGVTTAGLQVSLQSRSATGWHTFATVTTGSGGQFSGSVRPAHNTSYRAAYAGTAALTGADSASRNVKVASSVSIAASKSRVHEHGVVFFSGAVGPRQHGRKVELQQHSGGHWRTINTATLNARSHYRVPMAATSRGTFRWRVYLPGSAGNAAGTSKQVKVTVR